MKQKINKNSINNKKKGNIHMNNFYNLIQKERERQDDKWGIQRHDWNTWSTILTEECSEVAKACLEIGFKNNTLDELEEELIQVAAVSKAIYEHIQEIKNN